MFGKAAGKALEWIFLISPLISRCMLSSKSYSPRSFVKQNAELRRILLEDASSFNHAGDCMLQPSLERIVQISLLAFLVSKYRLAVEMRQLYYDTEART